MPGLGGNHSPPSNAELKNGRGIIPSLPILLHDMKLNEAQGQLLLYYLDFSQNIL
jgi:hypothetical protein